MRHKGNALAPYASRLKNAMVHRGYSHIVVTGYLGSLKVNGRYFEPGSRMMTDSTQAGEGPNVQVAGEPCPMNFKAHKVVF